MDIIDMFDVEEKVEIVASKRSRGYFRHHRERTINRRTKTAKALMWGSQVSGMYAKGKVPWDGKSARWKPELGPKWSDVKKLKSDQSDLLNMDFDTAEGF
jgi:hypothetical protein